MEFQVSEIVETDMGTLLLPDNCITKVTYEEGRYNEYLLTERMRSVIERDNKISLFIDIGANMGYYTRFASPYVENILSIEASLENYMYFSSNTADIPNVTSLRCMAWSEDINGRLYKSHNHSGDYRSFGEGEVGSEECPKLKLETILRAYEAVAPIEEIVVKIDTQGSDHIVLEGFGEYRDKVSNCFVECWPFGMERTDGSNINDIVKKYTEWGFEVLPIELPLASINGDSYVNLHLKRNV
jgi:FkbM family methyltransferase